MLGLVLLYVGAVLFINGLTMLGQISRRESVIMNVFTGAVSLSVAAYSAFGLATMDGIQNAAFGLLFGFTYLWVAYNNAMDNDGRGIGWFSLFVAITAVLIFLLQITHASGITQCWLALNWLAWAILWGAFFVIGVINKTGSWIKPVAYLTIAQSILTAWLPGFLILTQHMPN